MRRFLGLILVSTVVAGVLISGGSAQASSPVGFLKKVDGQNDCCSNVALSGDGKWAFFVDKDTNGNEVLYKYDVANGGNATAVTPSGGWPQTSGWLDGSVVSVNYDGTEVIFGTTVPLVSGDSGGSPDVYAIAVGSGVLARVTPSGGYVDAGPDPGFLNFSVNSCGPSTCSSTPCVPGNCSSSSQVDGRYVVFEDSSRIDPSGTARDVYRADLCAACNSPAVITYKLVSDIRTDGTAPPSPSDSGNPTISSDGDKVAFATFAMLDASADTNTGSDVYVRTISSATTVLASKDSSGTAPGGPQNPQISGDGNHVTFETSWNTNGAAQIYERNLSAGTTTLVSTWDGTNGGTNSATAAAPSADGSYVVFIDTALDGTGSGFDDAWLWHAGGGGSPTVRLTSSGIVAYWSGISADGSRVSLENRVGGIQKPFTWDNCAKPSASINDVSNNEGNSGTSTDSFTVTLSGAACQPVTVGYATANNTASAGSDYTSTSGTLSFPAGTTSKTIPVSVNGDTTPEPNESFFVNLSNISTNATISDNQGVGTILNDDAPTVSIADATPAAEGNSGTHQDTFTVTLSNSPSSQVSVDYITQDVTATGGTDYVAITTPGTLTFAANTQTLQQQVHVTINGDTTVESTETYHLHLQNPVNANISGGGNGTGTILDDDSTYQPDAMIKQPGDPSWTGDNVYSTDGTNESGGTQTGANGSTQKFPIQVQNDGNQTDSFLLQQSSCTYSPSNGTHIPVTYTWNGTDITSQVVGSGYTTPSVSAGSTTTDTFKMQFDIGNGSSGDKRTCVVTATSTGNGAQLDAVKGTAKRT